MSFLLYQITLLLLKDEVVSLKRVLGLVSHAVRTLLLLFKNILKMKKIVCHFSPYFL